MPAFSPNRLLVWLERRIPMFSIVEKSPMHLSRQDRGGSFGALCLLSRQRLEGRGRGRDGFYVGCGL